MNYFLSKHQLIYHTSLRHVKFSSVPDIGNNVFLNFCLFLLLKSDPLVYLMVPYYPGASLRALQADTPLTLQVSITEITSIFLFMCLD